MEIVLFSNYFHSFDIEYEKNINYSEKSFLLLIFDSSQNYAFPNIN